MEDKHSPAFLQCNKRMAALRLKDAEAGVVFTFSR
jgi:hypothetical protein